MTQAGAGGKTLEQMNEVMRFSLSADRLHTAFNALQIELNNHEKNALETEKKDFQLRIANAIWGERSYTFVQEYLNLLAENYAAGLRLQDFMQEPEKSRENINQWVSDETEQKITDLLTQGTITPDTRLVLTNAIYLKANWMNQFEPSLTTDASFTLLDGSVIQVPMMRQTNSFGYSQKEGHQVVQLPYVGSKLSMLILLPDKGGFDDMQEQLTEIKVDQLASELNYPEIELSMPKFKLESEFSVADYLAEMGMADAFEPGMADFSGMDGTRELYISAVQHKALINVDEFGTEAAAATAVVMGETSMPMEAIQLKIDRPFIFYILDHGTGTVLFMGRVVNP
jgi:serpin B